ncbi:MAG: hypothetical protein Q9217_001223 [Psora testacea]
MNGAGTRKDSVSSDYGSRHGQGSQIRLSTNAMVGASNGATTGNVQNEERRLKQPSGRSSDMLNSDDPVAMHLLMETAIGDSQQYKVLSFEEADELKKELPLLSSRIDATTRKLAIESKVRDAAKSLNRLNGPSTSGRKGTGSREGENSDVDIAAAHQKCEELAQVVWQLEKRQQEVQRQLLEHTAGVLQMTHKGFLENDVPLQEVGVNVHTNGYDGLEIGNFDDQSFYRALDSILDEGQMKGVQTAAFKEQTEAIVKTERRLWDLNQRLRDAITQATSGRSMIPAPPDPEASDEKCPEVALLGQVSYLENGVEIIQRVQAQALQTYKQSAHVTEERLEDLNTQLRGIILRSSRDQSPQYPLPPELSGNAADTQVAFLENGLDVLEQDVLRLKEDYQTLSTSSTNYKERVAQYENTLQDIWQRMTDGEKFSLGAFSSKVSSLNMRVSDLNDQRDILNRQIQQQRELNGKSDGEKDAKLASLTAELEQAEAETQRSREEMQKFEGEMVRLQTEVTVAKAELDGAYGTRAQRAAEVAQHPALQQEISGLKQELEASKAKSSGNVELQQRVQTLQRELSETIAEYEVMTKSSIDFEKERETLENTVDALRDRCEALETQLDEEKVGKLGVKGPGTPGDRGSNEKGATSTSVLKNEFKKMMRETRAENMRALRHEQEERRKLEAQLRELRRGQTLGKSSLSQSMTAS